MADPLTRPLDLQPSPVSPLDPVGVPGFVIHSGFIVENEKDPGLQGREKFTTYADILSNVSIVAAGTRFFLNLVARSEWSCQPADESPEAQRLADLTMEILGDMRTPLHRVVRQAALYKFLGFAALEWTGKLRPDGLYGFEAVDARSQRTIERWDVDPFGRVLGMIQTSPQTGRDIYIPRWKFVHLVDDSLHDSPAGLGLFRHIVKAAKRLERYELLEAWGYETDLRGIPIGRGPLAELAKMVKGGQLDKEDAAALRKPIDDFARQHNRSPSLGMVLDSAPYRSAGEQQTPSNLRQWDIELLKGDGSPHEAVAAAIDRTVHEIARVLGVEHLLLGSNDRGSYALSADKSNSFGMIVESALTEIREAFRKDLLTPLWELNGWPTDLMPKLKTDKVQYRSIEEVTGALRDMSQAGAPVMPDDPAIGELRDMIGLSRPSAASVAMSMELMQQPDPADDPDSDDPDDPAPEGPDEDDDEE